MSRVCAICGKGPSVGNIVVRKGSPKYKGGIGLAEASSSPASTTMPFILILPPEIALLLPDFAIRVPPLTWTLLFLMPA